MKCAFCGEEIQGSGYKIANDMRIIGAKPGIMYPITIIKDLRDACSRNCQIASNIAYLAHASSFKITEETCRQALEYCKCTEEEFMKGLDKYSEIMDAKTFMPENDIERNTSVSKVL